MTTDWHEDTQHIRRILVVEPGDDAQAQYTQSLQRAGYEVIKASDGREARVKALAQAPTLVLTETYLPLFDGYALCEVLRRDTTTRNVPILLLTTETESLAGARALKAGASAILIKPTPIEAILSEVKRLLKSVKPRRISSLKRLTAATRDESTPARVEHFSVARQRTSLTTAHRRFKTTMPPTAPPILRCPSCGRQLTYTYSHIGGVSAANNGMSTPVRRRAESSNTANGREHFDVWSMGNPPAQCCHGHISLARRR